MYLEHWDLKKAPFGNVPSGEIFYRSAQHEEALRRLLYAIDFRKGVAMLTGEVGCGKTTVTKALKNHLNRDRFQLKTISNPALQPTDLIKAILLKFGENTDNGNGSKSALLDRLQKVLYQNAQNGSNMVLAIDEAHVIGNQGTLDELRMLLNMQYEDDFLITLILLGQPPLLKNISELQPLKERISIKFNLDPLDIEDTLRYVVFRLKSAGARRGIFSREAIERIYEYSGGIPLRINNVCDRCLLIGLMRKAGIVDSNTVKDAIEDLGS
jgi:type II secretory pathway predicted ATPase ExeA